MTGTIDAYDLTGLLCSAAFVMGTPAHKSSMTWTATTG
jgi:hypothetical protein